jgi:hypothetical protein
MVFIPSFVYVRWSRTSNSWLLIGFCPIPAQQSHSESLAQLHLTNKLNCMVHSAAGSLTALLRDPIDPQRSAKLLIARCNMAAPQTTIRLWKLLTSFKMSPNYRSSSANLAEVRWGQGRAELLNAEVFPCVTIVYICYLTWDRKEVIKCGIRH